jgi:hypothetical protein
MADKNITKDEVAISLRIESLIQGPFRMSGMIHKGDIEDINIVHDGFIKKGETSAMRGLACTLVSDHVVIHRRSLFSFGSCFGFGICFGRCQLMG